MNKLIKKILTEISYFSQKFCLLPEYLSLCITYRCNFHCKACQSWKMDISGELEDGEWLKTAATLKNFFPKETFIEITGGEPLLKKDLTLKLISKLKQNFKIVALNSNGSLIDKSLVKMLEKAGLDVAKISFYSLDPKIENFLRGNFNFYQNTLEAINLISQSKIKLKIGILITSFNIKEIPKLVDYFKKFKNLTLILQALDEIFFSFEGQDKKNIFLPKDLWPNKKESEEFFNWVFKNKEKIENSQSQLRAIQKYYLNPSSSLFYRCFLGQKMLIIDPEGNVRFCFKHFPIGNIKQGGLKKILQSKIAQKERKEIKNCKKYCRILSCNFSRGLFEIFK